MPPEQSPHTISRHEMELIARDRVNEIAREFGKGFEFLADYPRSVTFFGASMMSQDNPYYISAKTLAGRIAQELKYPVITGGGPGIMEAASRGAYEAGGDSLGLTIKLPNPQTVNKYITKEFDPYYFFVRKVLLSFSSEAFIFFPGGFGTFDEFFEILTLIQTKKIVDVPLICVGADYWQALDRFIQKELLARGFIKAEDTQLYTITDNHDEILNIINKTPARNIHEPHSNT